MKNILLLCFCLLTVSCVSVKFPETLSVNVELDKESAKNLSEAIKNSNYKTIMMAHHKEKGMKMTDEDNITLEFASELPKMADEKNIILEFIEDASKKLDKFEKNKPNNIQIKSIMIDTVWTSNDSENKVKIEVKIDDN
jgi:LAS superfamily LD-carboxypeptidase LdcB